MRTITALLFGAASLCILTPDAWAQHPLTFEVRLLTVDSNEGCDIADIDGDGKLDVVAGRDWYHNGDWTPRPVRLLEDRAGYVRSNGEWAYDVNGDGRPDVISMDFVDGGVYWYENPGNDGLTQGLLWPKHLLVDTGFTTNEASYLVDIDGDGRPEWISDQWNKANPAVIWSFTKAPREIETGKGKNKKTTTVQVPSLSAHLIGAVTGHGIGFGDLNNDGRDDILVGEGWYERPEGNPLGQRWKFHADWQQHAACPMLVHDVDGDGTNDLITSKAHDFGLYLWRGLGANADGQLEFEKTLIDDSYSQAHCLHLADLDGDGTPELITGKRIRAHNGNDPGGKEPPVLRYYVWRADKKAYEPNTINRGQVGIGRQIRTADLDADGDVDIVVAGKEGTQILFNQKNN